TRGFTVTLTVVPVGTPDVVKPIDIEPGIGSTRSTMPTPPCGGDGTAWPPTDVMETVGVMMLTIGPGPGARVASGVVALTVSVLFSASIRIAPGPPPLM